MNIIQLELFEIFEKFRYDDNIEIEVRIGWIGNHKFKSKMSSYHYYQILEQLESCELFSSIEHKNTIDTTYNHKYRSIYNTTDYTTIVVEKILLYKVDVPIIGTPFDIRIVVNKELIKDPCKLILKDITYLQTKHRTSFVYKMWSYDVTNCIIDPFYINIDDDCNNVFSVEIEFIPHLCDSDISNEYISLSFTEKINDLLNIPSIKLT